MIGEGFTSFCPYGSWSNKPLQLEFKQFQPEHFTEYATWFIDFEMNRHLGPMDQAWLEAVLAQDESKGVTWSVFRDTELVAIVEIAFDPQHHHPPVITAIATKPAHRRQGIGSSVLKKILSIHKRQGYVEHIAYVSIHNPAGLCLVEKAGFVPVTSQPDEHGYLEFRHHQ